MPTGWKKPNSFCQFCTGNQKYLIFNCEDTACPFYQFRFDDLDHQKEKALARKVLKELGSIK